MGLMHRLFFFGGSMAMAKMGISLAPNQLSGGSGSNSKNPIASNLLGSGSSDQGSSAKNPAPNPTFSVQAAYTDQLWVNLTSSTSDGKEIVIPIQRAFGPLFIDSLGLGWEQQNYKLDFLFTGDVSLAGLQVSLIGLNVGVPVKTPY